MANGGPLSPYRSNFTCAVCMDIYQDPKFLACHHTFCARCIQNWADRYQDRATFPCPACRKKTSLPPGGAAALPSNFYLSADDLERARRGQLCLIHREKELDMFCSCCHQAICRTCWFTGHRSHQILDLTETIKAKKEEIIRERQCISNTIGELRQQLAFVGTEKQILQDKQRKVETAIYARHATLIATADELRDKELTLLRALNACLEDVLAAELDRLQENLDEVRKLDQRIKRTVRNVTGCNLLMVAKEMKKNRANDKAIELLTAAQKRAEGRLEFSPVSDPNTLEMEMHNFFGTASVIGTKVVTPEGTVMVRFRCGQEKVTEVYSLCPLSNCHVMVSYARLGEKEAAPSEEFDETGKCVGRSEEATGKVSWKSYGKGQAMYPILEAGLFGTHNKSQSRTHVRLCNNLSGQADIWRVKVTSEDPLETEHTYEFSIKVGAHRAHDVDASEQLLAVVEEGQAPDLQRKVWMFRRPQKDPVATYSPATPTFQPSDVCFYKLGGQQVLLVADELGDSIHVVSVQDDALNFVRYLVPDCPLLMQPTALSVDHKERLWIACTGGDILTIEPAILNVPVFMLCVCMSIVFGFLLSSGGWDDEVFVSTSLVFLSGLFLKR